MILAALLLVASPVLAGQSACPSDMASFDGYCMDRYEAPNIKGEKPFAYQTASDGEKWCAEKGKRLCKESEWVAACRGQEGRRFPYGNTYEKGRCNDDKLWRVPDWSLLGKYPLPAAVQHAKSLYQGDPSGFRLKIADDGGILFEDSECKTPEGVYDLTGNVAEWVVRTLANSTNYGHVMKGCYWVGCYANSTPDCRFANNAHPGNFRSYEVGFRCCKDRD